ITTEKDLTRRARRKRSGRRDRPCAPKGARFLLRVLSASSAPSALKLFCSCPRGELRPLSACTRQFGHLKAARDVTAHNGAAVGRALDFHPAIVQLDETVDEREAEPCARGLAAAASGGESVEDVRFDLRRDPRPGIGD